jgi:phosphoglycerate dehydrogenase-like enzyme
VLKDDVVIVNNARGGLIDEPAFAEWMQVHPAATAFLDVVAEEPLKPDHPFRRLPNIAVTPRIGWNSVEADAYLVQETFRSTMTAIDSGWTTADGEAGSLLLTEREQDAPL